MFYQAIYANNNIIQKIVLIKKFTNKTKIILRYFAKI